MAPEMLEELAEVLAYERLQPRLRELGLQPDDLVSYVMGLSAFYDVPSGPVIVAADPDDDIFLRCAEVAKAVYVVSGDRHLLDLQRFSEIPIVTVKDFLGTEFPDELL